MGSDLRHQRRNKSTLTKRYSDGDLVGKQVNMAVDKTGSRSYVKQPSHIDANTMETTALSKTCEPSKLCKDSSEAPNLKMRRLAAFREDQMKSCSRSPSPEVPVDTEGAHIYPGGPEYNGLTVPLMCLSGMPEGPGLVAVPYTGHSGAIVVGNDTLQHCVYQSLLLANNSDSSGVMVHGQSFPPEMYASLPYYGVTPTNQAVHPVVIEPSEDAVLPSEACTGLDSQDTNTATVPLDLSTTCTRSKTSVESLYTPPLYRFKDSSKESIHTEVKAGDHTDSSYGSRPIAGYGESHIQNVTSDHSYFNPTLPTEEHQKRPADGEPDVPYMDRSTPGTSDSLETHPCSVIVCTASTVTRPHGAMISSAQTRDRMETCKQVMTGSQLQGTYFDRTESPNAQSVPGLDRRPSVELPVILNGHFPAQASRAKDELKRHLNRKSNGSPHLREKQVVHEAMDLEMTDRMSRLAPVTTLVHSGQENSHTYGVASNGQGTRVIMDSENCRRNGNMSSPTVAMDNIVNTTDGEQLEMRHHDMTGKEKKTSSRAELTMKEMGDNSQLVFMVSNDTTSPQYGQEGQAIYYAVDENHTPFGQPHGQPILYVVDENVFASVPVSSTSPSVAVTSASPSPQSIPVTVEMQDSEAHTDIAETDKRPFESVDAQYFARQRAQNMSDMGEGNSSGYYSPGSLAGSMSEKGSDTEVAKDTINPPEGPRIKDVSYKPVAGMTEQHYNIRPKQTSSGAAKRRRYQEMEDEVQTWKDEVQKLRAKVRRLEEQNAILKQKQQSPGVENEQAFEETSVSMVKGQQKVKREEDGDMASSAYYRNIADMKKLNLESCGEEEGLVVSRGNISKRVEDPMVELAEGTGVCIKHSALAKCRLKCKSSGTMLTRFLLEEFFDQEQLANSSAAGRGHAKRPPLDPIIISALIAFVRTECHQVTESDLMQAINQKCTDVRKKQRKHAKQDQ